MFVQNKSYRVGELVKTTIEHESCGGKFEVGTAVIIDSIGDRGYDIKDMLGNRISEIGWII